VHDTWRNRAAAFAPVRRRYYDAGSERTAPEAEKHQQTSYILDTGISLDGTFERVARPAPINHRHRQ
jgi:hypothetical protein